MSVNRNILKSYSNPVLEPNQIPMELVSTTGTRFVMLNWPVKTYISASQGGDCTGITVQWSTDNRFASEPDNYYTNITSSVLSCDSSSLIPLTSSLGWDVTIDSSYNTGSNTYYYLRSFQNVSGGGRGPYSNVVSLETRAPKLYGTGSTTYSFGRQFAAGISQPIGIYCPGMTASNAVITTDSFNETTGKLQVWSGDNENVLATASAFGGNLEIVKTGNPNWDGIKTNGATIQFALTGSPSGSGREQNAFAYDIVNYPSGISSSAQIDGCGSPGGLPYWRRLAPSQAADVKKLFCWTMTVGLVTGSIAITGSDGFQMTVFATTSSVAARPGAKYLETNNVTFNYGDYAMVSGQNTINTVIGVDYGQYTCVGNPPQIVPNNMILTNNDSGVEFANLERYPSSFSSSLGSTISISTSPDCVFNMLSFGYKFPTANYRQQYGPTGSKSF
jgi:hypothetical protein